MAKNNLPEYRQMYQEEGQKRRVIELLADRNWEDMSLYELELLRGMIDASHDPGYMKSLQRKREERKQRKHMEEKPFQFNIKEYVEQVRPENIVIDEAFLRAFYHLPVSEQGEVIAHLRAFQKQNMGRDYATLSEGIQGRRQAELMLQWMDEQTKEWVTSQVKRIKDDPTFPLGI